MSRRSITFTFGSISASATMTTIVVATLAGIAACDLEVEPVIEAQQDGGGIRPEQSFEPRTASRECGSGEDCVIAPIVTNCHQSCFLFPVNRAVAVAELERAQEACAGGFNRNLIVCEAKHSECVQGVCLVCDGPRINCDDGVVVRIQMAAPPPVGEWTFRAKTDDQVTGTCTMMIDEINIGTKCSESVKGGPPYRVTALTRNAKSVTVELLNKDVVVQTQSAPVSYSVTQHPRAQCPPEKCSRADVTVTF